MKITKQTYGVYNAIMEKTKQSGNVCWEDEYSTDETHTTPTPSPINYEVHHDIHDHDEHDGLFNPKDQKLLAKEVYEVEDEEEEDGHDEDEDEDEEDDDTDTGSSFSLQECINEFRTRRIRRISTQSREVPPAVQKIDENDLEAQNRSNKEQEKKCKPCKDGFCYCFTSDSGDGGCSVTGTIPPMSAASMARAAAHMRRHRKSEFSQPGRPSGKSKEFKKRASSVVAYKEEPAASELKLKTGSPRKQVLLEPSEKTQTVLPLTSRLPLTAISRLETSKDDAPLIHIIQELHDNCVISEVRVNKEKVEAHQKATALPKKTTTVCNIFDEQNKQMLEELIEEIIKSSPSKVNQTNFRHNYEPTAPNLETIEEQDSFNDLELDVKSKSFDVGSLQSNGPRKRHKLGGRLLEKRLSYSGVEYKPKDYSKPPRKPPRLNRYGDDQDKGSSGLLSSSNESTSSSLKKAEKIIDRFLEERGVTVPKLNKEASSGGHGKEKAKEKSKSKLSEKEQQLVEKKMKNFPNDKRKSYPITKQSSSKTNKNSWAPTRTTAASSSYSMTASLSTASTQTKPKRTYPSLSDLEHFMDDARKSTNYDYKNLRKPNASDPDKAQEKQAKDIKLGWATPKLLDMLNCDSNQKCNKQFKSQAVQAGPQSIGWQIPPRIALDTVDSPMHSNLATNIEYKDTPTKSPQVTPQKNIKNLSNNNIKQASQSFIWNEQYQESNQNQNLNISTTASSKPSKFPKKSNLKKNSSLFLKASKKKILRLVTPKKDNKEVQKFQVKKTPLRSIAIQTSRENLNTPPGSYRSAAPAASFADSIPPSSLPSTPSSFTNNNNNTNQQNNDSTMLADGRENFDFSRTVQSPPRKKSIARLSQRKLNFPLVCGNGVCLSKNEYSSGNDTNQHQTKTYQSYNAELEQDLTLSKMNYVLNNIRARLEASDERAVQTFQEVERREQQRVMSFDCPDNYRTHQHQTHNTHRRRSYQSHDMEPIYSEIEEDSLHIESSPQFDNRTEPTPVPTTVNTVPLYATVNKPPRQHKATTMTSNTLTAKTLLAATTSSKDQIPGVAPPTPLGKFIQDSMKQRHLMAATSTYVSSSSEPSEIMTRRNQATLQRNDDRSSSIVSTSSASLIANVPLCQSLNNIRVMEHNSPPNKNRNLSKSDLSIHRSDIFFENLYRSELNIGGESQQSNKEQQQQSKNTLDDSYHSIEEFAPPSHPTSSAVYTQKQDQSVTGSMTDSVAYELPPREQSYDDIDGYTNTSTAGSQIIFSTPQKINQSTPKKTQTFTTKVELFVDSY